VEGVTMAGLLENKIALVTGGGSGIGKATALAYAREGAKVVVSGRNVENLAETVREIREAGGEAVFFKVDVARADEVKAMVEFTVETYGSLDCAFNNAGGFYLLGGGLKATAEIDEDDWDRIVSINLKGAFLCMKYELIQMLKQGSGSIVNNSSTDGIRGAVFMASYSASKHGVIGLTQTAALEYATKNIRINAVCPGWIQTRPVELRIKENPKTVEAMLAQEPIGRFGLPEEVAGAVVWLSSDAASFITGHSMAVDGGYMA
jgi:NAD(P)-dependent dehydrogenase (short-subunit alcohol dehydrogenase family)